MRALFLTNQFFAFAGSELVVLELAEELVSRDWFVCIMGVIIGAPLAPKAVAKRIEVEQINQLVDVSDYDLVWCQHGTLANIDFELLSKSSSLPIIVTAHLSPFNILERIVHPLENRLTNLVVFNSVETSEHLSLNNTFPNCIVSDNPAPKSFFEPRNYRGKIESILCVTNHLTPELYHALLHAEKDHNIRVQRVGYGSDFRRVEAKDILEADAVVTIGKTSQYAIASRTPLYLYDIHGGLGWITKSNFDVAASFNFSGRPFETKKDAQEIFDEILFGYNQAVLDMSSLNSGPLMRFYLPAFLDKVLKCSSHNHCDSLTLDDFNILQHCNTMILALQSTYKSFYRQDDFSSFSCPPLSNYFR